MATHTQLDYSECSGNPCIVSHRRCVLCGWLLLPSERSSADTRQCRHCETALLRAVEG
jgi:hypothetical protein